MDMFKPTRDDALLPDIKTSEVEFVDPFEMPEVINHIKENYPEYAEAIAKCVRPTLSDNPDELEIWEANKVMARKMPNDYESPEMYLRRVLYEETFSVNQNPENPSKFKGSYGFTPGGLVSHFYEWMSYNGITSEEASELPELVEPTLGEAVRILYDRDPAAADLLFPLANRLTIKQSYNVRAIDYLERGRTYGDSTDTIGYRMLRMFHFAPEMVLPFSDKTLQQKFIRPQDDRPRAVILQYAWHKSQVLLPNGSFTWEESPEIHEAVENLLAFRTHPETQVFFKYFSPSGYINSELENQDALDGLAAE